MLVNASTSLPIVIGKLRPATPAGYHVILAVVVLILPPHLGNAFVFRRRIYHRCLPEPQLASSFLVAWGYHVFHLPLSRPIRSFRIYLAARSTSSSSNVLTAFRQSGCWELEIEQKATCTLFGALRPGTHEAYTSSHAYSRGGRIDFWRPTISGTERFGGCLYHDDSRA